MYIARILSLLGLHSVQPLFTRQAEVSQVCFLFVELGVIIVANLAESLRALSFLDGAKQMHEPLHPLGRDDSLMAHGIVNKLRLTIA